MHTILGSALYRKVNYSEYSVTSTFYYLFAYNRNVGQHCKLVKHPTDTRILQHRRAQTYILLCMNVRKVTIPTR